MTDWPYARVLAEAAARPLLDGAAFRSGLVALQRTPDGECESPTADLARELEDSLRLRAGGVSLEVLRQARDFVWFGRSATDVSAAPRVSVRLHELLQRAGNVFDVPDAKADAKLAERAHRMRWLTLALPRDLLAAVGHVSQEPYDANLESLLREGMAQIHCHLSACLTFPALWTYLMATTGKPHVLASMLDKRDPPFGSAVDFLAWLAAAGLARVTLAQFLFSRDLAGRANFQSFGKFISRHPFSDPIEREDHLAALAALHHGNEPLLQGRTQAAYRRYVMERSELPVCRSLEELAAADPVGRCFPPADQTQAGGAEIEWAESRFCKRALAYLADAKGRKDADFERLFWQYQRVRCATFRFVTQEPGTAGLDWFVRFFGRISPMRRGLRSDLLMSSAIRHSRAPTSSTSGPTGACKIEVRIAPKSRWSKLREELDEIDHAGVHGLNSVSPSAERLQRGVVLHFQKDGPHTVSERRSGGAQGYGLHFVRFARQYDERLKEANAVSALLHAQPTILRLLRGLDVCGRELTQPTWVLLPLLLRLRSESQALAQTPEGVRLGLQPLRMTIHAGEDFRTLLEGLRRIHEPIEFGLLRHRERIGHAVALGVDVKVWCRKNTIVYQPAEERLEDLLWLCDSGVLCQLSQGVRERLMMDLWMLGQRIYALPLVMEPGYVLRMLLQARRLRHDPQLLANWNYPELNLAPEHPTKHSAAAFLLRYLKDDAVWRRGQEPVEVPTKPDHEAIEKAQRMVQGKVRELDLTIEANPTSNLLIAELGAIDRHPMLRLAPLSCRRWLTPRYRIALCDDDPLTFATTLLDEHRHIYFALRRSGYSQSRAIKWLKQRRKDAMEAAFTVPDRGPSVRGTDAEQRS